ncbi:MAG TPA: hypothetical protein VF796_22290 [Humisphaera sp.]
MPPNPTPRKPTRLYSMLAALAGAGLLAFEVSRLKTSGAESWFWIFVAGMMIALGLFGVFQRAEGPPEA